jgi:membrane-associated phospholipid phosphatase
MPIQRARAAIVAVLVFSSLACAPASAEKASGNGLGSDIKAYVSAPIRWDRSQWFKFGGVLAAVSVSYQYDNRARAHFVTESNPSTASSDSHELDDALPAALIMGGTWLAARLGGNSDGRAEARAMIESAAFSVAASYVLKGIAGRERPYEEQGRDSWSSGGDSFPSGHTAAAFAIGTVLAESGGDRYRWVRRVLGYGVAVGTAYSRVEHDAHWLSDTVAGAALGVATARFVMRRGEERTRRGEMTLLPTDGGVLLTYSVPLAR